MNVRFILPLVLGIWIITAVSADIVEKQCETRSNSSNQLKKGLHSLTALLSAIPPLNNGLATLKTTTPWLAPYLDWFFVTPAFTSISNNCLYIHVMDFTSFIATSITALIFTRLFWVLGFGA